MSEITVVIVNYNTAREVQQCIDSVLKQRDVVFSIVVIDNASSDNSAEVLRSYGDKIKLVLSKENLGFARGNNEVFHLVDAPYVYFLNPDAWLVGDAALRGLLDIIKLQNHCGILSTKMLDADGGKQTLPRYYYPGKKQAENIFSDLPGDICWVLGASMLMPSHLFEKIGGFDATLFMYGDDIDLGLRVRQAGYAICYTDKVEVRHIGGASERKADWYTKTMKKQKALHYLFDRHYPKSLAIKLVKNDLKRAKIRMLWNRLFNQNKYARYKAIADSSKQFLQEHERS